MSPVRPLGTSHVVMVVEDNEDLARLLSEQLHTMGHTPVLWTSDFDKLLCLPPWQMIDVALVDMMLGGSPSGEDVLYWLALNRPEVRRIVHTAVAFLAEAITPPPHAILRKPVTHRQIQEAIG